MRGKNGTTAQFSFRRHKNSRKCYTPLSITAINSYHFVLISKVAVKNRKPRIISSPGQDLEESSSGAKLAYFTKTGKTTLKIKSTYLQKLYSNCPAFWPVMKVIYVWMIIPWGPLTVKSMSQAIVLLNLWYARESESSRNKYPCYII